MLYSHCVKTSWGYIRMLYEALEVPVAQYLVFLVVFLSNIICPSVLFLLPIVLSALLRFMASYIPFGVFELFLRQEQASLLQVFSGVRVAQSFVFCVVCCNSLFVLLSFFSGSILLSVCSLFDKWLLVTPLVSSYSN